MMTSQAQIISLTAIIIDDELHGRDNLKKLLEIYCADIHILGCADSVTSAKKLVEIFKPDVVFLDINMPVLDGFDFLNEFDERNFMVVFVSAHEEFGINAIKANVDDYLLKPIDIKELKQTVKKLFAIINKKITVEPIPKTDKLVLPASHGFEVLVFDEIIRLEAEGCYTKIVIRDGKNKLITRTLKEFEERLPNDQFFRTHKSHLINFKYIIEYSKAGGSIITMIDGSKVELSRRKSAEFLLKIKTILNVV